MNFLDFFMKIFCKTFAIMVITITVTINTAIYAIVTRMAPASTDPKFARKHSSNGRLLGEDNQTRSKCRRLSGCSKSSKAVLRCKVVQLLRKRRSPRLRVKRVCKASRSTTESRKSRASRSRSRDRGGTKIKKNKRKNKKKTRKILKKKQTRKKSKY